MLDEEGRTRLKLKVCSRNIYVYVAETEIMPNDISPRLRNLPHLHRLV